MATCAALVALVLACLGPAETASQFDQRRIVLGTFPAGAAASRVYELSVAPCVAGKCPVDVRLLDKQVMIAHSTLDWRAPAQQANRQPAGANAGVGDPLRTKQRPEIWTWGAEETTLTTAAQSVAVSAGRTGLLIDQMTGFEHPKRRHYVYVADGNKLIRAWTATEPQGPYWTTVEVLPAAATSQDIVLFEGFQAGSDQPDRLRVRRFTWDEKSSKLLPSTDVTGLYAVTVGVWPNIAEARQAQSEAGECLASYWLLPVARSAGAKRYALRAVTAHKALAEEALREARSCAPRLKGSLSSYQP